MGHATEICQFFNPVMNDLPDTFRLTDFVCLNGRNYKLPKQTLSKLLVCLKQKYGKKNEEPIYTNPELPRIGIGLDCSLIPLRQNNLCLAQTTDFLYPVVDDPYIMGQIACANVLSDLYAIGVTHCDNIIMLVAISTKMSDSAAKIVMPIMMNGFKDKAYESNTKISGGQVIQNPWCTIGGVASAICEPQQYIVPDSAQVDDVLVLTKPLGTEVALATYQWLNKPELWTRIKYVVSQEDVCVAYRRALNSMIRLNRTAAQLMHKHNAHAATDVTGYGLLGHAQNLAAHQRENVQFCIHNLPIIAKMASVAKACPDKFQLLQGLSPEISGGLLIAFSQADGAAFCKELEEIEGYQAWIIGVVEEGNKDAKMVNKPRVIDIPSKRSF